MTGGAVWDDLLPPPHAYLVRDVAPYGPVRRPDDVYPLTLKGLLDALAEAGNRSYGCPQEVSVRNPGEPERVIRRFEDGQQIAPG